MATTLAKGQKLPLEKSLVTSGARLDLAVQLALLGKSDVIDVNCFGLDAVGKLSDDRYFVFFNQKTTPCGSLTLSIGGQGETVFHVILSSLPATIQRLVFTAVIDGPATMGQLKNGWVRLSTGGNLLAEYLVTASDFSAEKSVLLTELYLKNGDWRFTAIGQGFNDGLSALVKHFGGEVAEEPPVINQKTSSTLPATPTKLSLEKRVERDAPQLISLAKKAAISIEKKRLTDVQARVALVLDASGSMYGQYQRKEVQAVVDRIVPLAVHFDDDGELDTWAFAKKSKKLSPVTLKNVKDYVDQDFGGWNQWMSKLDAAYNNEPGVMRQVIQHYAETKLPVYVVFISDGGIYKQTEITKLIKETSSMPIFWQFVGIGGRDYGVLQKLDAMSGRVVDNANFFALDDIRSVSDADLYDRLLNEFPQWLQTAKQHRIV